MAAATVDAQLTAASQSATSSNSKIHSALIERLETEAGPAKTWVFFTDKGISTPTEYQAAIDNVANTYHERARQRRLMRGNAARGGALFDERDLPIPDEYIEAVAASGAKVHLTSRWLGAVSVWATREQAEKIAALPFVRALQPVARSRRIEARNVQPLDENATPPAAPLGPRGLNYGYSTEQLTQINLLELHDAGHTGNGVVVGILDTGFRRTHAAFNNIAHPLHVIAEYDFVDNDGNAGMEAGDPSSQHNHGTMILGCLGAYMPGSLVGGAFDASFILAKTEDTTGEYPAEEDNYVAGLEFIEANGADMSTSSLGYIDWYTQEQLDGLTAVTTIAINILTSHGVHHCNAAGNEYHDSNPATSSLIAPADGFQVLTCGAVDSSGATAYFSSDGPTADGRVKPEVLARGISTYTVSPSDNSGYTTADGTSLSTPLVACAVACLVDARPYWTVDQLRQYLFETADYYVANGTFDPLYVRGYGIIDAFAAYDNCPEAGVVEFDRAKYACEATALVTVSDCGLNTDDELVEQITITLDSTSEPTGEQITLTETHPASALFEGMITLSGTDSVGVLLITEGDTVTATYIDADDGMGGTNIVVLDTTIVDCTAPVISDIQIADVAPRSATITFNTDESTIGTIRYGTSCEMLTQSVSESSYVTQHVVTVTGLNDSSTYFFAVDAADEAGNPASDDNGGSCYMFATPDIPNFFTELFSGGNDLDNWSLMFSPNGTVDFYAGCAEEIDELPTDPAGGTTISLADDDYETINIGGGESVLLYGTSYSTFYVSSNGYITFGSGDTDYTEDLADHFSQPRIAGLYDDLNPSSGGTVSWKQEADRVVVTYLNVYEYGTTNPNTFQIEMFFNGDITISYLAVSISDGLAGLSEGVGLDPDYYPSDLSNMGSCGPRPPTAVDGEVTTPANWPVTIDLVATDDGLPEPPTLDLIIGSLPEYGTLADPGAGAIDAVPYTLVSGGNQVIYTPDDWYMGDDYFQFYAFDGGVEPEGGNSNIAAIVVHVTAPAPEPQLSFTFDTDPGWTTEGEWEFGLPLGGGSHNDDPISGYTGNNVYGYNLAGDYVSNMPVYTT